MNPTRSRLAIASTAILIVLVGLVWWGIARIPNTDRSNHPAARPSEPAARPSVPVEPAEFHSHPVGWPAPESANRQALREQVVRRTESLARAQDEALAGLTESEVAEALATFADSHRDALADTETARLDFLKSASPTALPPEADADRRRFEFVRRAVLEENLTLEEAEARLDDPPSREP
ncbi:MAG: hypothetical protein ACKV19_22785 [Verrucomicrobiales bacterium]